jgi:hypothetical protein
MRSWVVPPETRISASLLGFEAVLLRCWFFSVYITHTLSDGEGVGRIWFTLHFQLLFSPCNLLFLFPHAYYCLNTIVIYFMLLIFPLGGVVARGGCLKRSHGQHVVVFLEGQALREKDGFVMWTTDLFHQT